jgi:hypothetical protein
LRFAKRCSSRHSSGSDDRTQLRRQSPENGNIPGGSRRLSANWPRIWRIREAWRQSTKSQKPANFGPSANPGGSFPMPRLVGWGGRVLSQPATCRNTRKHCFYRCDGLRCSTSVHHPATRGAGFNTEPECPAAVLISSWHSLSGKTRSTKMSNTRGTTNDGVSAQTLVPRPLRKSCQLLVAVSEFPKNSQRERARPGRLCGTKPCLSSIV